MAPNNAPNPDYLLIASELNKLVEQCPNFKDTAFNDVLAQHRVNEYHVLQPQDGSPPVVMHNSGVTAENYWQAGKGKIVEDVPHWFFSEMNRDLLDRAFGTDGPRNVSATGAVVLEHGLPAAQMLAKKFGIDNIHDYSKRGVRPKNLDDPAPETPKIAHANNPFSRAGWNITKQGALIRGGMPYSAVVSLAASVGCKVGDTTYNKSHPANR
jgi:hypothetical protein